MTLEISDLDTIKDSALRKFDERVSSAGGDRDRIEREAIKLESQLEQLYSFTAAMARREPDVSATARLWDNLVKTCDLFAARVCELSKRLSLSSAAYDHILDIRTAAEELRALHSP